jgi:hypothetical protein
LLFRADAALDGQHYADVIQRMSPELVRAHRARLLFGDRARLPLLRLQDGGDYIATEFLRLPNKVPLFPAGNRQSAAAQSPAPGRQQTLQ